MELDKYRELAGRTICPQDVALLRLRTAGDTPTQMMQLLHSSIGMTAEVGEINTLIQKVVWYGKPIPRDELLVQLAAEYGDLLWYVMEGLTALGFDAGAIAQANVDKLRKRYPDQYTDQLAVNRDTAAEDAAVAARVGQGLPLGEGRHPDAARHSPQQQAEQPVSQEQPAVGPGCPATEAANDKAIQQATGTPR